MSQAASLGWHDEAACAGQRTEVFFPEPSGLSDQTIYRRIGNQALRLRSRALYVTARSICERCAVREQCLRYALANNERDGMWGGLDPYERWDLAKRSERR